MSAQVGKVAVIGSGSWGTAMAGLFAPRAGEVVLWCRDAALADPPDGETFWDYELLSADGAKWVSTAYGNLPDAPVELEDGRWAWQYSTRVYYMVCQPQTVVLRARRFTGNGYDESANVDVELQF